MREAPNDRPGLVVYSVWIPRQERRVASTSPETMALSHFLRIYISLFVGIVCTSCVSLFLLVWIVNNSNVSVDSLHRDFQTVYILTTDQWSRNPQLRIAIELRWLWISSGIVLAIGLFPNERANRLLRWLRTGLAAPFSRIVPTLTFTTGYNIDQFRMCYAMDPSPCTSPDLRAPTPMPLQSRPSSVSRHSLPPLTPESIP